MENFLLIPLKIKYLFCRCFLSIIPNWCCNY